MSYDEMVASSKTYSKIGRLIEVHFGIPVQRFYGGARADEIVHQVALAIKEESRRAAEEGIFRAFRLAAENLPEDPESGLYIPSSMILINAGGVGRIKTRPFNGDTRPSMVA